MIDIEENISHGMNRILNKFKDESNFKHPSEIWYDEYRELLRQHITLQLRFTKLKGELK